MILESLKVSCKFTVKTVKRVKEKKELAKRVAEFRLKQAYLEAIAEEEAAWESEEAPKPLGFEPEPEDEERSIESFLV